MAGSSYSVTIRDISGEVSNVKIRIGDVTAVNLPGFLSSTGAFRTALMALSLGEAAKNSLVVFDEILSADLPTSPYANRESALLVRYKDVEEFFDAPTNSIRNLNYGRIQTVRIPCPNLAIGGSPALRNAGSDFLNLDNPTVATFVTAFNGLVLSDNGADVEVQSIELVGRNN